MANETEIILSGRYLTLKNTTTRVVYFTEYVDELKYFREDDNFSFYPSSVQTNNITVIRQSRLGQNPNGVGLTLFDYSTTLNPDTGLVFVDADTMEAWIQSNIGKQIGSEPLNPIYISQVGGQGQPNTNNIVFVSEKSDFPTAVSGVITLNPNTIYFLVAEVDLLGDSIATSSGNSLIGGGADVSILKSTGLVGDLITIDNDFLVSDISFMDVVGTVLDVNSSGGAITPPRMVIRYCEFVGNLNNITTGSTNFLTAQDCVFNGGTIDILADIVNVVFSTCLFISDGQAYNMVELGSSAVVTNRIRFDYSTFQVIGSTTGININISATIPVDSYILDTIDFLGNGTYLQGIGQSYFDNEPRWTNCRGIVNTSAVSNFYMTNNATVTPIATINTPVKILGTTNANSINQKFTHTDNRLTYVGALQNDFEVNIVMSFETTTNNKKFGLYIAINGVVNTASLIYATSDGNNRAESIACQEIFALQNGDYVEAWIENATDTSNVTVTHLNLTVKALN